MSKLKTPITTGQIREMVFLRRAGASIEAALCSLVQEYGEEPIRGGDLADVIGQLIACEKSHGPLGERVQEIIARLTSGGIVDKTDDVRWSQAKKLWDKGFGRKRCGSPVDYEDFESYLATIPVIPASLVAHDAEFPLLMLIDPRLGLSKSCKRIGIRFEELGHADADLVPFDDRHTTPDVPFWARCHDGRKNCNRSPDGCRRDYVEGSVYAMTAMVAVHAYLHHPTVIEMGAHFLDCPGSVNTKNRDRCACLWEQSDIWGRSDIVGFSVDGNAKISDPLCGSGGFRRE